MTIDLDGIRPRVAATREAVTRPGGAVVGHQLTITCPYCNQKHHHGEGYGHRESHCATEVTVRKSQVSSDAYDNPGYVLCDATEDVNWSAERAMGQLWVARATYRRLTADLERRKTYPALTSKERRVRAELKTHADSLAEILRAAGVNL